MHISSAMTSQMLHDAFYDWLLDAGLQDISSPADLANVALAPEQQEWIARLRATLRVVEARESAEAELLGRCSFEDFIASRTVMTPQAFGALTGDRSFETDFEGEFLVYEGAWWIEALPGDIYHLTFENLSLIAGTEPGGLTLVGLEAELYLLSGEADFHAQV